MENKVFWAGVACGAAALLLRLVRRPPVQGKTWLVRVLAAISALVVWAAGWYVSDELGPVIQGVVRIGLGGIGLWFVWQAGRAKASRWLDEGREWADTGCSALLMAFLIMNFVIQAFKIPSGSMKNPLLIDDYLFVNKFIYGLKVPFTDVRVLKWHAPQRGDIVVFKFPRDTRKDFIKRCIGLPGEQIEVRGKTVFINGAPLEESRYAIYTDPETSWPGAEAALRAARNLPPTVIPPGQYFMLGDNRDQSQDSRFWGPLEDRYIKGKALFRYWPLNRIGLVR